LIFALQRINRYDTQIGLDRPPKVVKTEQKRFYFTDGKLIKLLVGKNEIKNKTKLWENSAEEIADLEKKLREAFKN
jgi:hypothetical protein